MGTTKWTASWFLPQPVRSSQAAEPQFPHLENGNSTHFTGGLILLNGTEHTEHETHGKACRPFLLSPLCTHGKGAQPWSPERQRETERRREGERQRQGRGGSREGRHTGFCWARLCDPPGSSVRGKNTGVGSLSLLQRIFPSQRSNLGLLHGRRIHYHLSHQGSPTEGAGGSSFQPVNPSRDGTGELEEKSGETTRNAAQRQETRGSTHRRARSFREQGPQKHCSGTRHPASACPGFLRPLGRAHSSTALGPAGQRRSVLRPSSWRPQEEICSWLFPGPRGHCNPGSTASLRLQTQHHRPAAPQTPTLLLRTLG